MFEGGMPRRAARKTNILQGNGWLWECALCGKRDMFTQMCGDAQESTPDIMIISTSVVTGRPRHN